MKYHGYEVRTLFGEKDRPYSVVAYPPHKEKSLKQLVAKTKAMAIFSVHSSMKNTEDP